VSARRRVFLGLVLVFELGLAWLVYRMVEDLKVRYRESAEELLVDTAQLVAALLATDPWDGVPDGGRLRQAMPELGRRQIEARIYAAVKREVNLRVYVTDRSGRVLYDSTGRHEGQDFSRKHDVALTLAGRYGARTSRDVPGDEDSSVMYVAAPILWRGDLVGVASVGKPTRSFQPFIEIARRNLILGGIGAGLAVVVLAVGVAVWLVRPFDLVAEYLRLVQSRRFQNLPGLGRTTLGVLGAAFDEMRDALAGRNYVEEYVQSLTHEIKSPLSAIRAAAELLEDPMPPAQRDRFLADIREESGRLQAIVERLLELSALEKRRGLADPDRVELAGLIREALAGLEWEATSRAVAVRVEVPPDRWVYGERFLLLRALSNLIRNALEFSPAGGRVDIALNESRTACEITVRDRGPGIPAYAERRVFERFYSLARPDTGRKSTGLGLSFVREIAELHHGRATLANHPDGGAVAGLRLPRA
jgi:two-component system sensor histidine kinase CreC